MKDIPRPLFGEGFPDDWDLARHSFWIAAGGKPQKLERPPFEPLDDHESFEEMMERMGFAQTFFIQIGQTPIDLFLAVRKTEQTEQFAGVFTISPNGGVAKEVWIAASCCQKDS